MAVSTKHGILLVIAAVSVYYTKMYSAGGVCYSTDRMDDKVAIVTGSNTGIGKETVVDFVNRGARVYMACRSLNKAERAAREVIELTGADNKQVIGMEMDLSSYQSIREFARDFRQRESRLDVLVNNAGVAFVPEKTLTVDGNELTFGTNHLGHFLLTHLLLDVLVASAPSRIVTVSSLAHTMLESLDMDNLNAENEYNRLYAYAYSKLANIMFSRELGKRLKGTGVSTYSLHPGSIKTEAGRHIPIINHYIVKKIMKPVVWLFSKTPSEGAQTQICCAVDKELEKETALYYSDCAVVDPIPAAKDDAQCKDLWDRSVAMVKLQPEEMSKYVRS